MRIEGSGFKFGMKLGAEHKGMCFGGQFGNFHQAAVGRSAREHQTVFFTLQLVNEFRIDFITMPVAFANLIGAIKLAL